MPKLDLTAAKRIKVASGEVSRLKGVGFDWVKPVPDLRAQVIAALFGNGEQGAMYDPSDLSTLFQDSAGTTPVTADSQPVGRMLDVSGNGNHATQATASRRPLYRTDGTLHWFEFDGFNDRMAVPTITTSVGPVTLASAAVTNDGNTERTTYIFDVLSASSERLVWAASADNAGTCGIFNGAWRMFAVDTESVMVSSAVVRSSNAILRVNGQQRLSWSGDQMALDGNIKIGSRNTGVGNYLNGRFYGLTVRASNSTDSDLELVESYLSSKSGVTL